MAGWVVEEAKKREGVEVELIDLRDWPLPFFDEPMSPEASGGIYTNELARAWAAKVKEADAYIIVTPEYNHGYPAVLKNALDYVYAEWNNKPVGFVSYGGISGGIRSVEQLRTVVIDLQMMPISRAVHIQYIRKQIDEEGKLKTEMYQESADNMLTQLMRWAKVMKEARNR